jgi:hypothetical protein
MTFFARLEQSGVGPLAFDIADEPEVLAGRLLAAAVAAGFDPQEAGRLAACVFLAANRLRRQRVAGSGSVEVQLRPNGPLYSLRLGSTGLPRPHHHQPSNA